jgi:hypothetical protein
MRGVIRSRKVKFKNRATGEEGWKWRFEIPNDSPLRGMIGANGHDAPSTRRWIAIPAHVASHRSILAAAVWVVLSELAVREGVAVTSPANLATMLRCHRDTAARLLHAVGARAITRTTHGIVYAVGMPVRADRAGAPMLTIAGVPCRLPNDPRDQQRLRVRLDRIRGVIAREGIDDAAAVEQVVGELMAAGSGLATVAGVIRVLEETHLRAALADPGSRETIVRLFSWRMRARLGGERRLRAPRRERVAAREAAKVLGVSWTDQPACGECGGVGIVLTVDELGREAGMDCPSCRRRE